MLSALSLKLLSLKPVDGTLSEEEDAQPELFKSPFEGKSPLFNKLLGTEDEEEQPPESSLNEASLLEESVFCEYLTDEELPMDSSLGELFSLKVFWEYLLVKDEELPIPSSLKELLVLKVFWEYLLVDDELLALLESSLREELGFLMYY